MNDSMKCLICSDKHLIDFGRINANIIIIIIHMDS